jgi:predicted nucleic acid-binding Zn finger protein
MTTKKEIIRSRRIRSRVRETQAFSSLGKFQQQIVNTGQNITAIHRSLETVKSIGLGKWEKISQNSINNSEIVRELYANSLGVKF